MDFDDFGPLLREVTATKPPKVSLIIVFFFFDPPKPLSNSSIVSVMNEEVVKEVV